VSDVIYEKLKKVRARNDLELPKPPNLRSEFVTSSGVEKKVALRGYQTQMVLHLLAMKRFVVGDDTGLGKTVETIGGLCHVWRREPDTKAVVLTKKSAVPQWEEEFRRFTEGVRIIVAKGSPKKRAESHEEWEQSTGPTVLIQGYSSMCNDFGRAQHWADYILVTDEATVYKTSTTRVHKVCRHLAQQADRCWALTATLIKNSLMEGYGIYKVVVPELFPMSSNGFMNHYCITRMQRVARGRQVPVIVGYRDKDIERFREAIDPYYLGRPKHSVADELPVLRTKDIKVGLTKFQRQKYEEALEGLLEMGDGDEKETTPLTAITYCQEIVNHPALIGFDGNYGSEKLDALVDLLTEGGDLDGEKTIVFSRFKTMVDVAIPVLEKAGVKCVRVTGAENEDQRKAAQDAFQDAESDVQVIFITMAGGDAINLQTAKATVFYDTPWSAGDYIQIIGRMIRIGSEHDRVYAIHLVCKDTVDDRVQAVRRKKMKLIEAVLGERLKGEPSSGTVYEVSSEIKDIFEGLCSDARK
jgi:SNF2 family DNA or RNA helicase